MQHQLGSSSSIQNGVVEIERCANSQWQLPQQKEDTPHIQFDLSVFEGPLARFVQEVAEGRMCAHLWAVAYGHEPTSIWHHSTRQVEFSIRLTAWHVPDQFDGLSCESQTVCSLHRTTVTSGES